mgnify:FL=1
MVVVVSLEMLGKLVDSCGQNRDLHLGRAGIAFMGLIGCDDSLFGFFLHDFHLIDFFAVRFPSERRVKMLREKSLYPQTERTVTYTFHFIIGFPKCKVFFQKNKKISVSSRKF